MSQWHTNTNTIYCLQAYKHLVVMAGKGLGFLLKNLEATSRVVLVCIPSHHRELALPNEPNLEIVCVLSLPLVGSVDLPSWWSYRA